MAQILPMQASKFFSPSDLLETFYLSLEQFKQSILFLLDSESTIFDPSQISQNLANRPLDLPERRSLTVKRMLEGFTKIEDLVVELGNALFHHNITTIEKYEEEITSLKQELESSRRNEELLKLDCEQQRIQRTLQNELFQSRITTLEKDVEDSKNIAEEELNRLYEALRGERSTIRRMEQWFQRRLNTIEYYLNELQDNPTDSKYEHLLAKVGKLQFTQPWNKGKNFELALNEALLNKPGLEAPSSGTATPFSHYVGTFSPAESQNVTVDQAFFGAEEQARSDDEDSLLDYDDGEESDEEPVGKEDYEPLKNILQKLNDDKLSLTEKEEIFCALLRKDEASEENLMHVRLADILHVDDVKSTKVCQEGQKNASQDSINFDSMPCGKKSSGTQTQSKRFNETIRIENLKKSELEAFIQLGTQQRQVNPLRNLRKSFSMSLDDKLSGFKLEKPKDIELVLDSHTKFDNEALSEFTISDRPVDEEVQLNLIDSLNNYLNGCTDRHEHPMVVIERKMRDIDIKSHKMVEKATPELTGDGEEILFDELEASLVFEGDEKPILETPQSVDILATPLKIRAKFAIENQSTNESSKKEHPSLKINPPSSPIRSMDFKLLTLPYDETNQQVKSRVLENIQHSLQDSPLNQNQGIGISPFEFGCYSSIKDEDDQSCRRMPLGARKLESDKENNCLNIKKTGARKVNNFLKS